ncbi:HECT-domain-containing protein [Apiospora arundinis]
MAFVTPVDETEELKELIKATADFDLHDGDFQSPEEGIEGNDCDRLRKEKAEDLFTDVVKKVIGHLSSRMQRLVPIRYSWAVCRLRKGSLTASYDKSCIVPLPKGTPEAEAICHRIEDGKVIAPIYYLPWKPLTHFQMYEMDEYTHFAASSEVWFIMIVFSTAERGSTQD